jgi:hypothetical protein
MSTRSHLPGLPPARPQTLVKRAKHGDDSAAGGMDRAMAHNIMSRKRFKETELDPDAEYDHDAGLEM